jgi:hypothetical protein
VTGRSSQFSLAVVGFRMLSGILPFRSDSIPGLVHEIVYGVRPSLRQFNTDLPAETDHVFKRALGRLPTERFSTCAEFVGALERAMRTPRPGPTPSNPAIPKPSGWQLQAARFRAVFRSRLGLFSAAAAIVLLLAAFWIYENTEPKATQSVAVTSPADADPDPSLRATVTAQPHQIQPGESATLQWQVPGATSVSIDHGIGTVPTSGTLDVRPSVSTTYFLTAEGPGESTTASVSVDVETSAAGSESAIRLAPPVIEYFRAQPPSVKAGDNLTLVWNVIGARRITIDHGIGAVVPDAGRTVPAPADPTIYHLRATGKGGTSEAHVTVTLLRGAK